MRPTKTGAREKAPKKPAQKSRTSRQPAPSATTAGKAPAAPPGCITARVKPDDAHWIAKRVIGPNCPQAWIVAGVLAEIGEWAIRYDEAAATMKRTPGNCLWQVINREEKAFSVEVPVYLTETQWQLKSDAKSMRRDMADWLGTLISMGIQVMEAKRGLRFMTEDREFGLLADSAALELIHSRKGEAA